MAASTAAASAAASLVREREGGGKRHPPRVTAPTLFPPSPLLPPFAQADLERRAGDASKASPEAASLLAELRAHVARLEAAARDEDPRLSFSTPEFKEAQRAFTEGFKV